MNHANAVTVGKTPDSRCLGQAFFTLSVTKEASQFNTSRVTSQLDFWLDAFLGAEVDAFLGGGHASGHRSRDSDHLKDHGQLDYLEADFGSYSTD